MTDDQVMKKLVALKKAAEDQGPMIYDHGRAVDMAGIEERGDDLFPVIRAWCAALPDGYPTIGHYVDATEATGRAVSEVFDRAIGLHVKAMRENVDG